MSSYFSLFYLGIFLPGVIALYGLAPERHRRKVLLAASYIFFWAISGKLLLYLAASTFSIHHFGLWMARVQNKQKQALSAAEKSEKKQIRKQYQNRLRSIVTLGVLLQVGTLIILKYTPFFGGNLNALFAMLGIPIQFAVPTFLLPIGISFYTLQAVSYLFDVYRNASEADDNLGRIALYMAFFPQIIEGPICRYQQTADQIWSCPALNWNNLTMGIQRILYGIMKKIIIADRLNLLIKIVFDEDYSRNGSIIAVAMVCYTCQLYMEFSGTMDVVLGSAEIFGIRMPENFRQPFFSHTIPDFWSRWHVTLGAWFRDYLFYPISMSRPLKHLTLSARKRLGNHYGPLIAGSIALLAVWISNGLWHGAGWQYLFFGLYHFTLILTGNILEPAAEWLSRKLHYSRKNSFYRGMQILRTVLLVNVGELFFRAAGLTAGLSMFRSMVTDFSLQPFRDGSLLQLGMDGPDFVIVLVGVAAVLAVSILREKGISLRKEVAQLPLPARWALFYVLIFFVIIFGAYGDGYVPVEPIYANF